MRLSRENFCEPCNRVAAFEGGAVGEGQSLPVLDRGALRDFEDEAGEGPSRRFVEEYLLMLRTRAAIILNGLAGKDTEAASRTLTSLGVTSAMAGALRLEGFCDGLERALERGHSPAVVAVKSILAAKPVQQPHRGTFPPIPNPRERPEGPAPRCAVCPEMEGCGYGTATCR